MCNLYLELYKVLEVLRSNDKIINISENINSQTNKGVLTVECYNRNNQYTTMTLNIHNGFVIYNNVLGRALFLKGLDFLELHKYSINIDVEI